VSVHALALATGYTWRQVDRGIALAGVRPLVLRAGARRVQRRLTEEQVDAVLAALGADTAAGVAAPTTAGLAAELGCSIRTVQRWAHRLAVERTGPGRGGELVHPEDADRIREAVLGARAETSAASEPG
jgi:hypothetical protein